MNPEAAFAFRKKNVTAVCVNIVILLSVALTLENIVAKKTKTVDQLFVKACADCLTHISIGIASWKLAKSHQSFSFLDVILAGIFSGIIDIDHFIAARSIKLQLAVSLPTRPLFHNVFAIPAASIFFWIIIYVLKRVAEYFFVDLNCISTTNFNYRYIPVIIFVAWTSHQLRDSIRRGLWLWGNIFTPPTPFVLYVALLVCIPIIVNIVLLCSISSDYKQVGTEEII